MPDLYGVSARLIAAATGASIDSARRWKRTGRMPAAIAALLELRLAGELGLVDQLWTGFRLVRGELWTPEGAPLTPGDLRAIPYRREQLAELERRAREPRQFELAISGAAWRAPAACACAGDALARPLSRQPRPGRAGGRGPA